MNKKTITLIIVIEILLFLFLNSVFSIQVILGLPFLFLYFIYRLIKGLMKYHHDLKSGKEDKMEWN